MAQPLSKTITMVQGDSFIEEFILEDVNGNPINITGWNAKLDVRRSKSDGVTVLSFTMGDGLEMDVLNGIVRLKIVPADTASIAYSGDSLAAVYDLQLTTETNTVLTPVGGTFNILKDVTRV